MGSTRHPDVQLPVGTAAEEPVSGQRKASPRSSERRLHSLSSHSAREGGDHRTASVFHDMSWKRQGFPCGRSCPKMSTRLYEM